MVRPSRADCLITSNLSTHHLRIECNGGFIKKRGFEVHGRGSMRHNRVFKKDPSRKFILYLYIGVG